MGIDVTKDALVIKIGAITLSIDFKTGAIKASGGGADVKYDRSTKTIKIGAAGTSMEFKKDGTGKLTISSGVYSGAVTFNTTNSNNQGRVEKFELNAKTKWLPASLVITPNWIVGGMNPTAVGTVTMKPFGSLTEGYKFEREYSVNLSTPLDFSDATGLSRLIPSIINRQKFLDGEIDKQVNPPDLPDGAPKRTDEEQRAFDLFWKGSKTTDVRSWIDDAQQIVAESIGAITTPATANSFVIHNQRGQHRILFNAKKTKPCHVVHALN